MIAPVHPRACGEQQLLVMASSIQLGSSPRVRGTVADRFWQQLAIRFIPARAGNRISITTALAITLVHPRACGEQEASRLGLDALGGSSPRVRGTVEPPSSDAVARRFIPARAGNRPLHHILQQPALVHPRACGEQFRILCHWPRASSRRSRRSYCGGSASRARPKRGWQCSSSSRGSTTRAVATPRSTTCPRSSTRGGTPRPDLRRWKLPCPCRSLRDPHSHLEAAPRLPQVPTALLLRPQIQAFNCPPKRGNSTFVDGVHLIASEDAA